MTATLGDLPLEDLLAHLADRRATGTLTVSTTHFTKKLFLTDGLLGGVSSTSPRELLGHFLVGLGLLDAEQLGEAMRVQERLGTPLGRIVERMGLAEAGSIAQALIAQAEEALLDLFLVPVVEQRFLENVLPTDRAVGLRLPLPPLLLEGRRRRQRTVELESIVGDGDAVPQRIAASRVPELSGRERKIISMIDGVRDVDAIALACHVVPFHVAELVAKGVAAGFLGLAVLPASAEATTGGDAIALAEEALAAGDLRHCWAALQELRERTGEAHRLDAERFERRITARLDGQASLHDMVPAHIPWKAGEPFPSLQPAEAFVLSRINAILTVREIQRITPIEELHFRVIVDTLQRLGLIELRPRAR